MSSLIFYSLLITAQSQDYGLWYFSQNYGQSFYDYSQNGYHAINGKEAGQDTYDSKITDRGAYFDENQVITLHNNVWKHLNIFPEQLQIILWIKNSKESTSDIISIDSQQQNDKVFKTISTGSNYQLKLFPIDNQNNQSSTITVQNPQNQFSLGKFQIGTWQYLKIKIQNDCQNYFINAGLKLNSAGFPIQEFSDVCIAYREGYNYLTQLGLARNIGTAFKGYVYMVRMSDLSIDYDDFIDGDLCSPLCYFGTFQTYCHCQLCVKHPNIYCISQYDDPQTNGKGESCIDCQGLCRANSQCLTCPQQNQPFCDDSEQNLAQKVCDSSCKTCIGPQWDQCVTCSQFKTLEEGRCECVLYSFELNETCECPDNSYITTEGCLCQEGFYSVCESCEDLICSQCYSTCQTCQGPLINQCKNCIQGYVLENNQCKKCQEGYYVYQNQCSECESGCLECQNNLECQVCSIGLNLENGDCVLQCDQGEFQYWEECKSCGNLCWICESQQECLECKDYSQVQEGRCQCIKGFQQIEGQCLASNFTASMIVSPENIIQITFQKDLEQTIQKYDLEITIEKNPNFDYSIQNISLNQLLIDFKFDQLVIKQDSFIKIEFLKEIKSIDGGFFIKTQYEGLLNKWVDEYLQSISEVCQSSTSSSNLVAVILSIFSSSPTAAWLLLSTVQIISYTPLSSTPFPPVYYCVLMSLNTYYLIPNLISVYIQPQGLRPHIQAIRYGFQTNDFLLNFGEQIVIFMFLWLTAMIFYSLSRVLNNSFIEKLKKQFFFGAFIRFLIQIYLDGLIMCLLRINKVNFIQTNQESILQVLDNISTIIFLVFFTQTILLLFPWAILYLLKRNQRLILDKDREFIQKWDSLFYEFHKNKGKGPLFYYFFFIVKRILFGFTLIYLCAFPKLQASILFGISFLFFVYLVKFSPFLQRKVMILEYITQGGIVFILAGNILFNFQIGEEIKNILQQCLIVLVFLIGGLKLFLTYFLSLARLFSIVKEFCKKKWGEIRKKQRPRRLYRDQNF